MRAAAAAGGGPLAYACVLGAGLVVASERIVFVDWGDFARVTPFMLWKPVEGANGMLWHFLPNGWEPLRRFDAGALAFGAFGRLQQWTGGLFYDLRWHSLAAKLALLVCAWLMVRQLALHTGFGRIGRIGQGVAFTALGVALFQAHNIGMLKTFYAEYVFFVGLPLLLLGLLKDEASERRSRLALITVGTLLCTIAKVQYLYLPLLVLGCLWWCGRRPRGSGAAPPLGTATVAALLAVQLVGLLPLADNRYAQLNHHQSTYFGSYLLMKPEHLRALGLGEREIGCVGIDSWGHRAEGPGGTLPREVGGSCFGERPLGLGDVLRPYLAHPSLLGRLSAYALPHHFTTDYFHVYRQQRYLAAVDAGGWQAAWPLVWASRAREAVLTPLWWLVVVLGAAVGLLGRWQRRRGSGATALGSEMDHRRRGDTGAAERIDGDAAHVPGPGLHTATLLLALFIPTQIAISLLGEGIRDLSKHLWAAQLALDLLALALLAHASAAMAGSRLFDRSVGRAGHMLGRRRNAP